MGIGKKPCPLCRNIRWILLSVILGGGAGFVVHANGGSQNASMAATFGGAILPLMWRARRQRSDRGR
jgi:disulfide bond formation protein DsbB